MNSETEQLFQLLKDTRELLNSAENEEIRMIRVRKNMSVIFRSIYVLLTKEEDELRLLEWEQRAYAIWAPQLKSWLQEKPEYLSILTWASKKVFLLIEKINQRELEERLDLKNILGYTIHESAHAQLAISAAFARVGREEEALQVLIMREVMGMTRAEIKKALSLSEQSVRTLENQAKKALQKALEGQ